MNATRATHAVALAVCLIVTAARAGAAEPSWSVVGADPDRGAHLIAHLGCGGCHIVPGVPGARGEVGPPLTHFGRRGYIAGMLRNTPPNLVRWLRDPQGIVPGNAMPDMGITEVDARDIASYLYTLR